MVLQLFGGSDSDNDDVSKIEIDREYAKRFEYNKKREDLHRLQELKKKGVLESPSESESDSEASSSSEEEDDFVGSSKTDREFFEALIKVKKQDPVIKNKDIKLFESVDEEDEKEREDGEDTTTKKKKAMYLKDVVAKHLIEDGPDFEDEEEEEKTERKKSYVEEQEEIKKEFLEAVAAEDDEGDLLKMKEKNEEDEENEGGENGEFVRKLDEYFGGDGEVDEGNKFLKDFFRNRMWVDKEREGREIEEEELERLLEDEEEIERQEEYEYRFQENAGDVVMGHARKVEGSVRKNVNARKEQRKSKEERMEAARIEREEELKRLKNLKKEEMDEKLKRILKTAGMKEDEIVPLSRKELEEEFDPDEYDRMMKKAFGEEYYGEEDADPEFGSNMDEDEYEYEIEKPDFEKEDEMLGLPKGWDETASGEGFLAARKSILQHKMDNGVESDQEKEEEKEEEEEKEKAEEGKRKRKRKRSALLEKAKEAMMDEYYKLDYEDTIGDLKTRFKYTKTKPNRFGLSAAELLMMDEKELNQYISLKKLAPYREKEWKLSDKKRYQLKMKTRELLRGVKASDQKDGKKKRLKDSGGKSTSSMSGVEDGKAQFEELNGDASNLSRKARRRRRQAEVKLSHSRLMAYGKIPSKSRSKAKH